MRKDGVGSGCEDAVAEMKRYLVLAGRGMISRQSVWLSVKRMESGK